MTEDDKKEESHSTAFLMCQENELRRGKHIRSINFYVKLLSLILHLLIVGFSHFFNLPLSLFASPSLSSRRLIGEGKKKRKNIFTVKSPRGRQQKKMSSSKNTKKKPWIMNRKRKIFFFAAALSGVIILSSLLIYFRNEN